MTTGIFSIYQWSINFKKNTYFSFLLYYIHRLNIKDYGILSTFNLQSIKILKRS